jgi:hypothetical protein
MNQWPKTNFLSFHLIIIDDGNRSKMESLCRKKTIYQRQRFQKRQQQL